MRPPCSVFLKRLSKQCKTEFLNSYGKNKKDKIKRSVIYQPLSCSGLNFPNVHTIVKSLRLSWLGRFLNCINETWQVIPNNSFNRYGGLPFLLKCNYDSKYFDKKMSIFYSEMLDYFQGIM